MEELTLQIQIHTEMLSEFELRALRPCCVTWAAPRSMGPHLFTFVSNKELFQKITFSLCVVWFIAVKVLEHKHAIRVFC